MPTIVLLFEQFGYSRYIIIYINYLIVDNMDIGDFEGCKALKRILPCLYSLHILMMLILPFSLPRPYQIYNLFLLAYLTLRSLLTLAYTFKGAKEAHRLLSRQDSRL
jgi:hypothetical protein